ncbi:hypothetical protein BGZ97_003297, partial [Linnemannia gamsii]
MGEFEELRKVGTKNSRVIELELQKKQQQIDYEAKQRRKEEEAARRRKEEETRRILQRDLERKKAEEDRRLRENAIQLKAKERAREREKEAEREKEYQEKVRKQQARAAAGGGGGSSSGNGPTYSRSKHVYSGTSSGSRSYEASKPAPKKQDYSFDQLQKIAANGGRTNGSDDRGRNGDRNGDRHDDRSSSSYSTSRLAAAEKLKVNRGFSPERPLSMAQSYNGTQIAKKPPVKRNMAPKPMFPNMRIPTSNVNHVRDAGLKAIRDGPIALGTTKRDRRTYEEVSAQLRDSSSHKEERDRKMRALEEERQRKAQQREKAIQAAKLSRALMGDDAQETDRLRKEAIGGRGGSRSRSRSPAPSSRRRSRSRSPPRKRRSVSPPVKKRSYSPEYRKRSPSPRRKRSVSPVKRKSMPDKDRVRDRDREYERDRDRDRDRAGPNKSKFGNGSSSASKRRVSRSPSPRPTKKRSRGPFDDEEDFSVSSVIGSLFGTRYRSRAVNEDLSDDDMEARPDEVFREEARSARIAKKEDEMEAELERQQAEKARKRKMELSIMNDNPFDHLNQTAPVSDTQHIRKSNPIRNDLGVSSPKSKAMTKSLTQSLTSKAPAQELRTPSMVFQVNNDCDTSQPSSDMSNKAPPLATDQNPPSMDFFPQNLPNLVFRTELPALQDRVERTEQLVYCNRLLLRRWLASLAESTVEREIDNPAQALQSQVLDKAECQWLAMMEGEPMVRYRLRWLVARMVHEFVNNCNKDSTEIAEIVSLGPVLPKELFRKLLSSFIKEVEDCLVLNVELLQGLVQLVQSASSDYLNSDDLILSMLRTRLQGAHRQSSEHSYHLTLAVSHILDVMADHKVKDLGRVLKHELLSGVLSGLQDSSDPFLMYQTCYAFQALQYVPDNGSPLQAIRRHSIDAVDGSVKVSGKVKLDVDSALERLGKLQEAFSSTVEKVTSTYKTGQLRDLKQLIYEAPCRRDPLFQFGICQLLGEIAVDPFWAIESRQQAVSFLSSLCEDDTDWCRDESILAIITKLGSITDRAVSVAARTVLQDLKEDQAALVQRPYPLMAHLPISGTSPVLAKIQKIPYLEPELYKFRLQRLQEAKQPVLIPPMGKVSLKASDDDVFPLTEKVQEFLNSERQVMLILGDSGSGKSTFNKHLESDLLHSYINGGPIPLFINLPAIDRPDKELITKHLKTYNFSEVQIQEMKDFRQFVVICDGYDESQLTVNLHTSNLFNRPGQWNVKMIISCRTQYLSQDYRGRFVPQGSGHYNRPAFDLFQEAVIAPFSKDQIEDYVDQYVLLQPRTWTTQDYMHKLTTIPNLLDLVSNPFLLTLALEALPGIIEGKRDVATITITRVQLYDTFVNHWIDVNKRRLENNTLSVQDRDILEQLLEAGYKTMALDFVTRLASEIFDKQDGHPIVQYVHLKDENTWRVAFFGLDPKVRLLRESAPLSRTGTQYRFIHRSMLEYFFSRSFYNPSTHNDGNEAECHELQPETDSSEIRPLDADSLLFKRDLLKEPSVIQFLCERVKQNPGFQAQLLAVIHKSKIAASVTTAATNAITILVRAGVSFNGADLRGIRIPGADLSNGWFDAAQLQGADLRDVNFSRSWLRKVDFSGAQMEAVRFGELPFLEGSNFAFCCAYSPDGARMAFGLSFAGVTLFDTSSWTKTNEWYTSDFQIACLAFSPDSRRLVLGNMHGKVEILDMSDTTLLSLIGHVGNITCVVFSPCGTQVASASGHEAVRLWNSETGECLFVMEGHSEIVAYSPSGHQLVTGDGDGTFRFWDPATGEPFATQISTGDRQRCLAWSPDGRHIASSIPGGGVRLWNAENGNPGLIFRGHSAAVTGVAFSPDGQLLASSSEDGTVRLWDASTTNLLSVYYGHYGAVWSVTFSPDGQQ